MTFLFFFDSPNRRALIGKSSGSPFMDSSLSSLSSLSASPQRKPKSILPFVVRRNSDPCPHRRIIDAGGFPRLLQGSSSRDAVLLLFAAVRLLLAASLSGILCGSESSWFRERLSIDEESL